MAVGAEDDEIHAEFLDLFLKNVEGAAITEMSDGCSSLGSRFVRHFLKGLLGAGAGFRVEGMDGGKFLGRETVGGIGRLRLDYVKKVEFDSECLGHLHGGIDHTIGCIGKINSY